MKKMLCLALLLPPLLAQAAAPIPEAGELLKKARQSYDALNDYTCMINSRELVQGKLKQQQGLFLMFKKPANYHMQWSDGWVDVYYTPGQNQNMMKVHGGALLSFLRINVPLSAALKYSRHTLPESDLGYTLGLIEKNYQQALGDKDASLILLGKEILNNQPSLRFKAVFPPDRGYYGHEIMVNLHENNGLPLKIEVYGWKNELLEQYEFINIRLNPGLKASDFELEAPPQEASHAG